MNFRNVVASVACLFALNLVVSARAADGVRSETYEFDLSASRDSGVADYDTGVYVAAWPVASIAYWNVGGNCYDESVLPPYLRESRDNRTWLVLFDTSTDECDTMYLAVTFFHRDLAGDTVSRWSIPDRSSGGWLRTK